MTLVFASNNAHKLSEVRQIMPAHIRVLSLNDIGFTSEIEENGTTLSENSAIKAQTIWEYIRRQISDGRCEIDGVFADDTGLEIDALNGAPGVYTARWYMMEDEGCQMSDVRCQMLDGAGLNRAKALRVLAGEHNRGAQFRTVITLIRVNTTLPKGEEILQVEGIVRGRIAEEEYGQGGFGYDPIFIPEGYDKTFAELPAEVKNSISHRARALEALVKSIQL